MSKFNLNAIKASSMPAIQKGDTVSFTEAWISATGIKIKKGERKVVHWIGHHTSGKRTYTAIRVLQNSKRCIVPVAIVKKGSSQN